VANYLSPHSDLIAHRIEWDCEPAAQHLLA